jgi:hypothetical protein
MKTHRRFTAVVLALLVGMIGGLLWGSTPALAQTPSRVIAIAGTVNGPPEQVPLAGQARLTSTLVTDPTFNGPSSVILTIDILTAHGKGLLTNKQYISSGNDQVYRTRLLVSLDTVEITFPFFLAAGPKLDPLARAALASFNLSFDTKTGEIIGASGTIGTPNF